MHRRYLLPFIPILLLLFALSGCRPGAVGGVPTTEPTPSVAPTPIPTATPTPAPAVGPQYQLFVEPDEGRDVVLEAFADAEHTLRIAMYQITDDEIIRALKDTAAQGVTVRMILELNPYGGSSQNAVVARDLEAAGVDVQWDPKTIRYFHQKTVIVDDVYALVMTGNFTTSAFTANREYIVKTVNPDDLAEIIATFEADWARQPVAHANPRLAWAPTNARDRLLSLIDAAQASIDVEHQNMQDEEVIQHLLDALTRGVRVRVLSSPNYPLSEDADEPGRDRLRQAGAEIRYLDDPYIHAKAMAVDGRTVLVGSVNLTSNSLDFNRELSVLVDEPRAVAAFLRQFDIDWDLGRDEAFPVVPTPEAGYIDHTEAARYFYQEMTVELTVQETYNSGRVIWLMGDDRRDTNFKVVIFPSDWDKWPQTPDQYYRGKKIRVSGLIEKYRGWPEIIVNDPSQIQVVE